MSTKVVVMADGQWEFDFSGSPAAQAQAAIDLLALLFDLDDPEPKQTAQWLMFEADSRESAEGPTLIAWREGPALEA